MAVALRKLHAKHREILRLHLNGYSSYDIANELGLTPVMVSYTISSDLGQLVLESMQRELDREALDVQKQIHVNARAAEAFLGRIVNAEGEGAKAPIALRAKVCMDQLDRAGNSKIIKNVNVNLDGELTAEEIMEMKAEGRRLLNVVPSESFIDIEGEELNHD